MGYYFDANTTYVDNEIVSAVRQVPLSGGGLAQIFLPGFFDVTKWKRVYIKEWGRRWYPKSQRCVMIYRTDTLIDGIYEIQTVAVTDSIEDGIKREYKAHYFEMRDGEILLLDNGNQVYDRLQQRRGNLDHIIGKIRKKHGYSLREIQHMLDTLKIDEEYAEELKIQRAEKEAAYALEQSPVKHPTANLQ